MTPLDPLMYSDLATFYPAGSAPGARGGATLAPGGAGVTLPCYAEPVAGQGEREETYHEPESRKRWLVFTATDPGAGVDSFVFVHGMTLNVVTASRAGAYHWWTECARAS